MGVSDPDSPGTTRRAVLAKGCAAAAAGLLAERLAAADGRAAAVEDRASTIRIKSLTPTPVGTRTMLKMETSHGVVGWGEVSQLPPAVAVALVESVFEL